MREMRHIPYAAPLDLARPQRSTWHTIVSLLPYLWPRNNLAARVRVVIAMACLVAAKIATVYVPVIYSHAVDALAPKSGATAALTLPVALIVAYALTRVASSGFGELRDAAFAPVQQRAARQLALRTFAHLHALSLRFHLDRQTGGLSRVIDRGAQGVQSVLRLAVFNIVPTLLELGMVTGILWAMFDWRFALITFVAVSLYLGFTVGFSAMRVRLRRAMNETDNEAQSRAIDSLLNFETVKYFGNEGHEANRFDHALARYERAAVRSQVSLNMLNLGQQVIVAIGLGVIMLMAARGVLAGDMTVGKFVLVNTYLMQLYQPLNFLGFVYREIRQGLVDMDQLFRLLDARAGGGRPAGRTWCSPAICRNAPPARCGSRAFVSATAPIARSSRVSTSTVPAGGKLAIVGPTGAGKSTITRLLFRFYDVTAGRILIDGVGHPRRDAGKPARRDRRGAAGHRAVQRHGALQHRLWPPRRVRTAEIEHAARLAQIHDFVMSLPEKYDTRVGERGLKLSGGEKQRVAIARTILKDPRILILDEATSALDTATEQDIQAALRAVSQPSHHAGDRAPAVHCGRRR